MDPKVAKTMVAPKYANMTLEELSELHDADEDEILSNEAFDSEDERRYGAYFDEVASSTAFNSDDERKYGAYFGTSVEPRNVAMSLTLDDTAQQTINVARGAKMILKSVCLDVYETKFDRIRLLYRCTGSGDKPTADFLCLANFLGRSKGGANLQPSAPLSLEVFGPAVVEFKVGVIPQDKHFNETLNIFGNIMPIDDALAGNDLYHDAYMSDDSEEEVADEEREMLADEEEETARRSAPQGIVEELDEPLKAVEDGHVPANDQEAKKSDAPAEESRAKKSEASAEESRKRKIEETDPASETNGSKPPEKMTKKQRKRLAEEKAKQLEATLQASRNNGSSSNAEEGVPADASKAKKKKKKKKKAAGETSGENGEKPSSSRPRSQTRERRIGGGLVISDVVLGTGAPVRPGKRISLHYTGSLRSTGDVFDKNHSRQHPLVFRQGTGEVIRGLERGLEGMKAGGERVITVPSKLGYGSKGAGSDIPPDSDLVFEVKVVKVG